MTVTHNGCGRRYVTAGNCPASFVLRRVGIASTCGAQPGAEQRHDTYV